MSTRVERVEARRKEVRKLEANLRKRMKTLYNKRYPAREACKECGSPMFRRRDPVVDKEIRAARALSWKYQAYLDQAGEYIHACRIVAAGPPKLKE